MPTTVGDTLREYPLLLSVGWSILGIWVGVGLAMAAFGVSGIGVLLGLVFAAIVAFVGNKATRQAIKQPDTLKT